MTEETRDISTDDQLKKPSPRRRPNAKQSESSKQINNLVYQCRRSDRNKKGDRKGCTRHVKSSSLNIREKQFECNTCKRAFTTSNSLTRHLRIHSDEKPYRCKICKRAFNQIYSLTRHLSIHSGEKPFECNTCKRAFNQSNNLKKHLKTHGV